MVVMRVGMIKGKDILNVEAKERRDSDLKGGKVIHHSPRRKIGMSKGVDEGDVCLDGRRIADHQTVFDGWKQLICPNSVDPLRWIRSDV